MKRVHMGARYASLALIVMLTLSSILMPMAAQAAPNPAPAESAQQGSWGQCSTYHYVRYGQTLSGIAAYYGVSVHAIMQANGIYNPNHIYVGQKLCIPGGGGHPYPPSGNCYTYHYVRHGETLSGIAVRYGVSVHALMNANGIRNPNHIYSGQKLCIPGGGYAPPVHPKPPVYPEPPVHPKPPPSPCGYHPCPPPPPPPPPNPCHPQPQPCYPQPQPCHPQPQPCPVPPHPQPCHPQPQPCHPDKPTHPGQGSWLGKYYDNKYLEGAPAFERYDAEVRFNWYTGSPGPGVGEDHFSVRWERNAYFDSGHYRFYATSDDGVRVYVDGTKIIDGWNVHPPTEYVQDVYIHAGHRTVVVEYYEESGDASVYVRWGRR